MQNIEPTIAIEYILKAIVACCVGQLQNSRQEMKIAETLFQLVGSSESECDTIPGRQAMASYNILIRQFEDVIIYLESIKEYVGGNDAFNYNYGMALTHVGRYKEAESMLLLVQNTGFKYV